MNAINIITMGSGGYAVVIAGPLLVTGRRVPCFFDSDLVDHGKYIPAVLLDKRAA
jgi:hypothetical protein